LQANGNGWNDGSLVATTSSTSPPNADAAGRPAMPPRWKTAVVVWLAIYPSITLILWLLGPTIQGLPLAVRTLVITVPLVPLMTFVVVPVVQRLLAPWLSRPADRSSGALR
jgi:antibiotic biosynthesis monooxygenase (ABM) superfamily enzyme